MSQESTYFNFGVSNSEDFTKQNYFSLFPEEILASVLDAFVINRPMAGKVGGDGFWIHQREDFMYIVAFDCMGHGHLASMMTRVYTQAFDHIIVKGRNEDPGYILERIHRRIKDRFKGKKNLRVGTGADIGLLKINLSVRKIYYAGAKMDLIHVQDGNLNIIKGDRLQIGELFEYAHNYETHDIPLEDGSKSNLYLATDGFRDLIGGSANKKLGKTKANEVLEVNFGKPMSAQKELIKNFIDNWSGSQAPLDDTLLIGITI